MIKILTDDVELLKEACEKEVNLDIQYRIIKFQIV